MKTVQTAKKTSIYAYIGMLFFILVTALLMIPVYYLVISTFKTQADAMRFPSKTAF